VKGETQVSQRDGKGKYAPDPRDRNLSSPRRALVAGLVALLDDPDHILVDGLHRKRVAAISGQSRQTLHRYFPDQDSYIDELFRLVLDPTDEAWPVEDPVDYMQGIVAGTPTDSLAIVRKLAHDNFVDMLDNEHWLLTMVAWALGRKRPEVRADLARSWEFYADRTAEALGALLDHWDAELAPPFDLSRAAQVFAALGDGLAIRSTVIDGVDEALFADTIAAIAHAIVVPREAAGGRFEPQLPAVRIEPVVPLDPATVEGVLQAALRCYESSGASPTMTTIAREAQVAEAAIAAHFGGTPGLLVALWDRFAADLDRRYRGLDRRQPVLARLRSQLTALVDLAATCQHLTAHFLVIITTPQSGAEPKFSERTHEALSAPFEDLLRSARQTGQLDFTLPPRILAGHLVGTALGNAASSPSLHGDRRPDVDEIVERVWMLVLDGCRMGDEAPSASDRTLGRPARP
jgi:AcrR family transcriptional regulator